VYVCEYLYAVHTCVCVRVFVCVCVCCPPPPSLANIQHGTLPDFRAAQSVARLWQCVAVCYVAHCLSSFPHRCGCQSYFAARKLAHSWTYLQIYISSFSHIHLRIYIHVYLYICVYIYIHTYAQVSPLFRSKVQEWASVCKSFFPAKPASGEAGGGWGVPLVNWQEALNDDSLRRTISWPAGRFCFVCAPCFYFFFF